MHALPADRGNEVTNEILDNENISIEYSTDCTEIIRNRIVYIAPETTFQCILNIKATFEDQVMEENIPFSMTALEDLPKIPALYITTENNAPILNKEDYV